MRGEREAGAERVQRVQDLEPLLRSFGQSFAGRCREVGIGARLGAPDAAAQLIEGGEAEHIRAVHDERVRVGDVETGFDDRRREQHIVLPVVEGAHDIFELRGAHLPVCANDAQLWHFLGQKFGDVVEVGDAGDDVEGLPTAMALAAQGLADDDGVEGRDVRPDSKTVDRRRGDERELTHTGEGELQGARDRRRGEREDMHVLLELLQALLVTDAEMLLFVDDKEAETRELDLLAEQRVRADHDVDGAVLEACLHL